MFSKGADLDPASCEVTRLVRQVCGGDNIYGVRSERSTGAKNAQLLCVNGGSPRQPSTPRQPITPRQPSTPQLLRILEETIQKKTPRSLFPKQPVAVKDAEKFRMSFNIPERVSDALFQYRTKFVQHMLTSSMYANSSVGKPWEKIGSVSEKIIDELLLKCANQMELQKLVDQMYRDETC
ncbi:jg7258 [Pararge aegeria aegeria]|uniref:Jg7258 protein n=1 Tax=Pararge aegeria aegeria TaxID=348720 RepID=A0A8S4SAR5_9NEOP|nr:jg7258 [Pararge aegeria aegeria]